MNKAGLKALLRRHGIPIEQWGQGSAKTLDDLHAEITSGEAKLIEIQGGITRTTDIVALHIYAQFDDHLWYLIEERQVFTGGRIRMRETGNSLSEKMRPGKKPVPEADRAISEAARAISEELGLPDLQTHLLPLGFTLQPRKKSLSYPGLQTSYRTYFFEITLPTEYVSRSGYVEQQSTKTTYFKWLRVERK